MPPAPRAPTVPRYSFVFFNFRWHEYKRQNQATKASLSWVEFKAFLQESLGDSRASVYTTWNRFR